MNLIASPWEELAPDLCTRAEAEASGFMYLIASPWEELAPDLCTRAKAEASGFMYLIAKLNPITSSYSYII
jgi:ethanolamine utilization microcompartment shell protein EutS